MCTSGRLGPGLQGSDTMAESTSIEWCDSTLNPWIGCDRIGPGCDGCYAAVSTPARTMGIVWGPKEQRYRTKPATRHALTLYEFGQAKFYRQYGRRRRVFVASLSDVFDNAAPQLWRHELWRDCLASPNVDKLVLTKRVGNVRRMVPSAWLQPGGWPTHVWLGITVVNRAEMLRDAPKLAELQVPVSFWSYEPALGPLGEIPPGLMPSWGIAGGESDQSGHLARAAHPQWFREMRDEFKAACRPWLFKQWGEYLPVGQMRATGAETVVPRTGHAWDDGTTAWKIGTKAAGRRLDGKEHLAWPA